MGLRINSNIAAMNAYRNLSMTQSQMESSLEKLSSGFRINRAADDAAGLSISEGLRAQIGGLQQASRNAQDGVNVVQTADGALTEVDSILQRMRDLAVQASNSGSQDVTARQAAQTEFSQLNQELDRIGSTTSFGGAHLLDGTFGNQAAVTKVTSSDGYSSTVTLSSASSGNDMTLTVDAGSAVTISLSTAGYTDDAAGATQLQNDLNTAINAATGLAGKVTAHAVYDANTQKVYTTFTRTDASANTSVQAGGAAATSLGIDTSLASVSTSGTGVFQVGANNTASDQIKVNIEKVDSGTLGTSSLDLVNNASAALSALDNAITSVSTTRANLGAYQNRFEHTINNLNVAVQNLSASESQIRDTDMAQEMTNFTRDQILQQAGTAMLAQANQAPQTVLKLLG